MERGRQYSPYEIATWQNLYWISATDGEVPEPNRAVRWAAHYLQTADIDFADASPAISTWDSNQGWTPIGNDSNQFTGNYNGRGFVIRGLIINRINHNHQGFFGAINSASIDNVHLQNVNITGYEFIGGFSGICLGENNINNCSVSGNINGFRRVGGFIGMLTSTGNIRNCHFNGSVTGRSNGAVDTGGFVGHSGESGNTTIEKCSSQGTTNTPGRNHGGFVGWHNAGTIEQSFTLAEVDNNSSDQGRIGGFAGSIVSHSSSIGYVNDCYSRGSVAATGNTTNTGVGGFTGSFFSSPNNTTHRSYATGSVTASNTLSAVGGFNGLGSSAGSSLNFWDTGTTGQESISEVGVGKTTSEMKYQTTYDGWDFNNVWNMDSVINDGYPNLQFYRAPGAITLSSPANGAEGVSIYSEMSWEEPETGGLRSGYKLYLYSGDPEIPENYVYNGVNQGILRNYTLQNKLLYNTTYHWRVDSYNVVGETTGNIWSFTTTDEYFNTNIPPVNSGTRDIMPSVTIPEVEGAFEPVITSDWNPADIDLPNAGLYLLFKGANLRGRYIEIDPDLGFTPLHLAYRLGNGDWVFVPRKEGAEGWTMSKAFFTIPPPDSRNEDDLEIVFPADEGQTLPVELSSYTAVVTAEMFVQLEWTAETETNMLGYNIYRGENYNLEEAVKANFAIIPAYNQSVARVYSYMDKDVESGKYYYYWLQSNDLDLTHEFHGPVSVFVEDAGEPGRTIELPFVTELKGAFPNPFNPGTYITFAIEEKTGVSLNIYNLKGQLVRKLIDDEEYDSNRGHQVYWDGKDTGGSNVSSGIYLYEMRTNDDYSERKKMIMIK